MEMAPLQTAYPYRTGLIAVVVGIVLIGIVRRLILVGLFFGERLNLMQSANRHCPMLSADLVAQRRLR